MSRSFYISTFVTLFLTVSLLFAPSASAQENTFESAREAVDNMRLGWNLGNTLDSNSGDTLNMWIEHWTNRASSDYEKAWGQPVTKPALMALFREAGFNAIRVPVTWYPHMEAKFKFTTSDNSYWYPSTDDFGTRVQKTWMRRVKQIVDYVISQDMYCILNVHHDTGAASTAWLIATEEDYARERERFEALWTQIAEEFRDYDHHLLFEGYNEMLDGDRSWCFASYASEGNYNAAKAQSAYNAINGYAQSFVNAVRATGGNNAQRNLIVSTYAAANGAGSWNTHLQDPLKQLKVPQDEAEGHIIFEVHSYTDIKNLASAKTEVRTNMVTLKNYLVRKGAPVIFGEWGTLVENAYEDYRDNLLSFAKYFVQQAKANGIGTFYWMGLSDGNARSKPEFSQPDLVEALVKGYYGDDGFIDAIPQLSTLNSKLSTLNTSPFTLSGQRLPALPRKKGLYIVNGRKVVVTD